MTNKSTVDEPVTLKALEQFMLCVAGAVRNPPDDNGLTIRLLSVAIACQDVPAGAITPDVTIAATRTFQEWPSTAEVYGFLTAHAGLDAAPPAPCAAPPETAPARAPWPRALDA